MKLCTAIYKHIEGQRVSLPLGSLAHQEPSDESIAKERPRREVFNDTLLKVYLHCLAKCIIAFFIAPYYYNTVPIAGLSKKKSARILHD